MRFKIAEHTKIEPVPSTLKFHSGENMPGITFLITNANDEREFIIKETSKIFIEKFITPKTFQQVNNEIADEVNIDTKKIEKITKPFFKHIKHRRFIVPENFVPEEKSTSLFNINSVVDQYKIEEITGINDDTEVYRATDLTNDTKVILKLIRRLSERKIKELKREFEFLKLLNDTAIAPAAYNYVTADNYHYFLQEFVEGLSLPQFISRKKNSGLNVVLKIAANIINAFKRIHVAGIVHGDIHPSNIIITNNEKIKVIDFGLSLNHELDKDELVNFGGAYFFMPPERIKTSSHNKFTRKPDFYSDVFQLGIVLYVFLYDEYPFDGLTWEELSTNIKQKRVEFPALSKHGFAVPQWLKDVITTCLSKKPVQRFKDAQELYNVFLQKLNNNAEARSTIEI